MRNKEAYSPLEEGRKSCGIRDHITTVAMQIQAMGNYDLATADRLAQGAIAQYLIDKFLSLSSDSIEYKDEYLWDSQMMRARSLNSEICKLLKK